jgi:flagellar FliJ protein
MSLLRTLGVAIEVAGRKRDAASQALGQAQQRHIAAQNQLTQLETYANETEARWTSQAQVCALPELMRHHYQFMERLDQATQMQKQMVQEQARWVEMAKKGLLEADIRVATLRQVLVTKQKEAERLQNRREQKQMDEFAAQRFGKSMDRQYGEGT